MLTMLDAPVIADVRGAPVSAKASKKAKTRLYERDQLLALEAATIGKYPAPEGRSELPGLASLVEFSTGDEPAMAVEHGTFIVPPGETGISGVVHRVMDSGRHLVMLEDVTCTKDRVLWELAYFASKDGAFLLSHNRGVIPSAEMECEMQPMQFNDPANVLLQTTDIFDPAKHRNTLTIVLVNSEELCTTQPRGLDLLKWIAARVGKDD